MYTRNILFAFVFVAIERSSLLRFVSNRQGSSETSLLAEQLLPFAPPWARTGWSSRLPFSPCTTATATRLSFSTARHFSSAPPPPPSRCSPQQSPAGLEEGQREQQAILCMSVSSGSRLLRKRGRKFQLRRMGGSSEGRRSCRTLTRRIAPTKAAAAASTVYITARPSGGKDKVVNQSINSKYSQKRSFLFLTNDRKSKYGSGQEEEGGDKVARCKPSVPCCFVSQCSSKRNWPSHVRDRVEYGNANDVEEQVH